jgi:hypothetical protein
MALLIIRKTRLKAAVFACYVQVVLRNVDSYVHLDSPIQPPAYNPILRFDSSSSALAAIRVFMGEAYRAATLAS